jgi:hypothetical protein
VQSILISANRSFLKVPFRGFRDGNQLAKLAGCGEEPSGVFNFKPLKGLLRDGENK